MEPALGVMKDAINCQWLYLSRTGRGCNNCIRSDSFLMSTANLSLDSFALPFRLEATNLLCDGLTLLKVDWFGDVLVDSLAPLLRVLGALLVDDLLLPDLLHRDAVGRRDVVAVLHRHHLCLLLLNILTILGGFFHTMFPCVGSLGFRVDHFGLALFVFAPRPGVLDRSSVTFLLRAFFADVVLVAIALLKHRRADFAGALQLLPGGHTTLPAFHIFDKGTFRLIGCTALWGAILLHHSVLNVENS